MGVGVGVPSAQGLAGSSGEHRILDLDCHPGLSLCLLKAIFLFLSSNYCLDVILIFCCFNLVSALLISVALPMSLCPSLPRVSIPKHPESLSLSLYLWVSVPSFSEPPSSSPWASSTSLWVLLLTPPLPLPVSTLLLFCMSIAFYHHLCLLSSPCICLGPLVFCCSLG